MKIAVILLLLVNSSLIFSKIPSKQDELIPRMVSIYPFVNESNNPEYQYLREVLRDAVRASLQKQAEFRYTSFGELDGLIRENQKEERLTEPELIELSSRMKADIAVSGRFVLINEKIMIVVNALDVIKKSNVISLTVTGNAGVEVFELIQNISDSLALKMKEEFPKVDKNLIDEWIKADQEYRKKNSSRQKLVFIKENINHPEYKKHVIYRNTATGLMIPGLILVNLLPPGIIGLAFMNNNGNFSYNTDSLATGLFNFFLICTVLGILGLTLTIVSIPLMAIAYHSFRKYRKSLIPSFHMNLSDQSMEFAVMFKLD